MNKSDFGENIKILNLNLYLTFGSVNFCNIAFSVVSFAGQVHLDEVSSKRKGTLILSTRKKALFIVLKFEIYILNKMKLSKLRIPYQCKKSNDSIVHSDDATYSKLHVPIVRNIINIQICG